MVQCISPARPQLGITRDIYIYIFDRFWDILNLFFVQNLENSEFSDFLRVTSRLPVFFWPRMHQETPWGTPKSQVYEQKSCKTLSSKQYFFYNQPFLHDLNHMSTITHFILCIYSNWRPPKSIMNFWNKSKNNFFPGKMFRENRSIARSLDRSVARSLGRSAPRSLGRSVARLLGRSLARSVGRFVV